jgi:hypothetical protein
MINGCKAGQKNRFGDHKAPLRPDSETNTLLRWITCIITYGALVFGVKRLFSIEFTLHPLEVKSNTAFKEEDLDYCLSWLTPLSILLAANSLFHEVKTALRCCKITKRNWLDGSINLIGCIFFGLLASGIFLISLVPHSSISKDTQSRLPAQLKEWHTILSKNYQLASPYMFYTRTNALDEEGRMEVIIEGSNIYNGDWKEYDFRFKPGNTSSRLPIVSPHQPRLDWQMWFAAREDYESNHWLLNLVYRLLTNQEEVLELMGNNPFPDDPPNYIRCTLYRYQFASGHKSDEKYSATNWWVREPVGEYLPILSLDEPSLDSYVKETGLHVDSSKTAAKGSNLLRGTLEKIRSLFGQGNGSSICLVLVITGFLLTLLDPSINLLGAGATGVEPVANGIHYSNYPTENDIKSN